MIQQIALLFNYIRIDMIQNYNFSKKQKQPAGSIGTTIGRLPPHRRGRVTRPAIVGSTIGRRKITRKKFLNLLSVYILA